jgi:hypothetical protein
MLIFTVALCARLVPLQFSPLPYNIDGFPLARISELMIGSGSMPDPTDYTGLLGYNMKLPVFSVLLAVFSLVLGIPPLTLLPYFCALIGSLAVVFIYTLTLKLTENDLAAFSAGMFAALTGLFVYVTTAAMKQLLAITLLCFILYLYSGRKDWRYRAAMIPALLLLPFTHHLTTLIAILIFSFALVGTAFRRSPYHVRTFKEFLLDVIIGPVILMLALAYYRSVDLEIASEVLNLNDAVLMASVAVIFAVAARLLSMTVQTKPWFFLGGSDKKVGFIGIGALYLNSRVHLFTGAQTTSDALLRLIFPYLALAVIALMGFNVLRYSKFPQRHLIVGMFLAPLGVMLFSVLNGLDLFGFMLAYRSYNFIDIPLAVAAGVGIAYIAGNLAKLAREQLFLKPLPAFSVAIFLILCALSLPLAYSNQETFGVVEVTQEYEMDAMRWASGANAGTTLTDQRYGDIMAPYFDSRVDKTGPWKWRDSELAANQTLILSRDWTTQGAQMYPFGPVIMNEAQFNARLDNWNVVYCGGPDGVMVVAVVR